MCLIVKCPSTACGQCSRPKCATNARMRRYNWIFMASCNSCKQCSSCANVSKESPIFLSLNQTDPPSASLSTVSVTTFHHHWSSVVSRGWAKASACHLQVSLSCAFRCHIVSLQYLSRTPGRPSTSWLVSLFVFFYIWSPSGDT